MSFLSATRKTRFRFHWWKQKQTGLSVRQWWSLGSFAFIRRGNALFSFLVFHFFSSAYQDFSFHQDGTGLRVVYLYSINCLEFIHSCKMLSVSVWLIVRNVLISCRFTRKYRVPLWQSNARVILMHSPAPLPVRCGLLSMFVAWSRITYQNDILLRYITSFHLSIENKRNLFTTSEDHIKFLPWDIYSTGQQRIHVSKKN